MFQNLDVKANALVNGVSSKLQQKQVSIFIFDIPMYIKLNRYFFVLAVSTMSTAESTVDPSTGIFYSIFDLTKHIRPPYYLIGGF